MIGVSNEDAAAYTFIMVILLIFSSAIIYAYLTPSLNKITDLGMNKLISQGQASEQTVFVYKFNLGFFEASVGIGLIGFAIFAIVRSIEVADAGNNP